MLAHGPARGVLPDDGDRTRNAGFSPRDSPRARPLLDGRGGRAGVAPPPRRVPCAGSGECHRPVGDRTLTGHDPRGNSELGAGSLRERLWRKLGPQDAVAARTGRRADRYPAQRSSGEQRTERHHGPRHDAARECGAHRGAARRIIAVVRIPGPWRRCEPRQQSAGVGANGPRRTDARLVRVRALLDLGRDEPAGQRVSSVVPAGGRGRQLPFHLSRWTFGAGAPENQQRLSHALPDVPRRSCRGKLNGRGCVRHRAFLRARRCRRRGLAFLRRRGPAEGFRPPSASRRSPFIRTGSPPGGQGSGPHDVPAVQRSRYRRCGSPNRQSLPEQRTQAGAPLRRPDGRLAEIRSGGCHCGLLGGGKHNGWNRAQDRLGDVCTGEGFQRFPGRWHRRGVPDGRRAVRPGRVGFRHEPLTGGRAPFDAVPGRALQRRVALGTRRREPQLPRAHVQRALLPGRRGEGE